MNCFVCGTDEWENVDQYRLKPQGMAICKSCGVVAYPEKYMNEAEAKKYYAHDYRKPPQYGNLVTGHRKLQMHAHFLKNVLSKWKNDGKEEPKIFEVGAAYGLLLNWLKGYFPKADVSGTEYAESYRRNAWHEFGIELGLDFDTSKKYDLIISFKVAEHQLDVDKRLREMAESLSDDGVLYISVPTWFDRMHNFGLDGFDLEYYYHPDHINVWTKKLFETCLKKAGLRVIEHDGWIYDDTYICVRDDSQMEVQPEYENYNEIVERMKNIKAAYLLTQDGEFEKAISVYPNYPLAWIHGYERKRALFEKNDQGKAPLEVIEKEWIKPALSSCPFDLSILKLAADIYMRYDRFDTAIEYINEALQHRPNYGEFLRMLHHCLGEIALRQDDDNAKIKMFTEARDCARYLRETDMSLKNDALNWIYFYNSKIPTQGELNGN